MSETEAETWFYAYKAAERAKGREPMGWSDWLNAGMPVPEVDR